MTEFYQIAGMSTPATERLKSSVRKAWPCSPRWRRWNTVSPSGPWAVEEPAFLMADSTPFSSNGLYEGSTRCVCSECSIVKCLSKACAITFELEACAIAFPSKAIEIFGGALDICHLTCTEETGSVLGLVVRLEDSKRVLHWSCASWRNSRYPTA